ncbi:SDR family oxidoreductase [Spirulina major]|uniref:SDR family oxidoreductase n=1 Tax=Spirulina major TaxID=270636 RepID=UPI001587C118|nr:sugar nucleotide-binding protein [Spirulina major]
MIKTAIIGASGYIGWRLLQSYRNEFPDCIGTTFSQKIPTLHHFDIRCPDLHALNLIKTGHKAVLIASAKPNISFCENNQQLAYDVNVKGTLDLARQAEDLGLPIIFLSTDYVFEGTAAPYKDSDIPKPTTQYGLQKLTVEQELPSLVSNYLILRLSKVYGTQKKDGTLLDEVAKNFTSSSVMRMASDQLFCPTHIDDIIDVIHELQITSCGNKILNLCNPHGISRYEIAMLMADAMNADKNLVHSISLHDLPRMRSRPLDTRMSPSGIVAQIKPEFISTQQSILQVARAWYDNLE